MSFFLSVDIFRKILGRGGAVGGWRSLNIFGLRGSSEGREWWEMKVEKLVFEGFVKKFGSYFEDKRNF